MKRPPVEQTFAIRELNEDGLGVSTLNDRPVRVRNALPGETVTARVLRKRRGTRFAEAVAVEQPSGLRVRSACRYFPRCGGCAMHHIAYPAQLELKSRQLAYELARHGVAAERWHAPVSCGRLGYRRKARLGVRVVGEAVLAGFRESFSNRVARVDECAVLTPRWSALLPHLKRAIARTSAPARVPQVELAEGDASAAIMVRHLNRITDSDRALWEAFGRTHGIQVLLQPGGYDTLFCAAGGAIAKLSYQIPEYGLSVEFHPTQFTQVNAAMNRELVRTALGYLAPLDGCTVADLFCGIGNFTLPLARAGADAVGYEIAADAVETARCNARRNGLAVAFHAADLYASGLDASGVDSPDHDASGLDAPDGAAPLDVDAILLDPPRSGAGPNLRVWASSPRCRKIVYVSCSPASFASDAKVLLEQGFRLTDVGVFDMFPQTAHVETIGAFARG